MERPIKELLIILRDNSQVINNQIKSGLCWENSYLEDNKVISFLEYKEIRTFIAINRPKNKKYGSWGWEKKLWEPRLEWLNFHINSL